MTIGIIVVFFLHNHSISILKSWYFVIFSSSFSVILLSAGIIIIFIS